MRGTDVEQQFEQGDLAGRSTVGDSAVVGDDGGQRPVEQRFGADEAGVDAGDEQRGDGQPGGGGNALHPIGQLFDDAVEVARHPREGVEDRGAVDEVGGRQNVRGIGRPEDQPSRDQVGGPRGGIEFGMIGEPARDDRLSDDGAALAVGDDGEVAQPHKAVRPVAPRRWGRRVGEAKGRRRIIPGMGQSTGGDARADGGIAGQRVGGNGEQLEREMAAQANAVERGAIAQPVQPRADPFGQAQPLVASRRPGSAPQSIAVGPSGRFGEQVGFAWGFERRVDLARFGTVERRCGHWPRNAAILAA